MREIVTSKCIIRLIDFQEYTRLSCPESCSLSKNGLPDGRWSTCKEVQKYVAGGKINVCMIKLLVINTSHRKIKFDQTDFHIIDSLGFAYRLKGDFCSTLHSDNRALIGSCEVLPKSQTYYTLYTYALENDIKLSKIHFVDCDINRAYQNREIIYTINVVEEEENIDTTSQIDKLKIENSKLLEELQNLKDGIIQKKYYLKDSDDDLFPIRHRVEEDSNYLYVISEEKDKTVTFHRNFDLKKSNHNWVNKKEPVITIKFDDFNLSSYESQIISPVYGIFEYEKKQFIEYGEVICRIRKYPKSRKEEIFLELERQSIKDDILRREQKKKLEREVLDELISEGLVFNQYVDRYGNSTRVTRDLANAVWNRDGGRCCYCGSKENLQFDHIIPIAKGGATTFQNIQVLCRICNIRKSDNIG
jgi:hypothetical protein